MISPQKQPFIQQKLYCYVDETGQDTRGRLFIVVAVIVDVDRESLRALLHQIEVTSGKGMKKCVKSTRIQRQRYVEAVIQAPEFTGKIYFAQFSQTTNYLDCVCDTIAKAVTTFAENNPMHVVTIIDGLQRREQHQIGRELRQRHLIVDKVRGIRDESEELIRLADAFAGFCRDAIENSPDATKLYEKAILQGAIKRV